MFVQGSMGRMEGCCLRCHPRYKQAWRKYVTLAIGVAAVVLVTALPTSLCLLATERGPVSGLEGLAQLEKAQQKLQAQLEEAQRKLRAQLEEAQREQRAEVAALGQALAVTNQSLTKALAITSRSLTEAHKQWDSCSKDLKALWAKVSELEQQLTQLQHNRDEQEARTAQLQEDNRALEQEVAQQKQQLEDLQRHRNSLQSQIWNALAQLQDMRSRRSSGSGLMSPGVAVSLSLLALFFAGMLLL